MDVAVLDKEINLTRGILPEVRQDMSIPERQAKGNFFVGQEGEFLLLDSCLQPIETVKGKIVRLMEGNGPDSLYAMIMTERGVRPARLT